MGEERDAGMRGCLVRARALETGAVGLRPCCLLPLFVALVFPVISQAAPTCPPGPDRVSVQVQAGVTFDAGSGLYTYSYVVANGATSVQDVDGFGVDVVPPVVSAVRAPAGWLGRAIDVRPRVQWSALEVANPDVVTNDASVPPSTVQIPPGAVAPGFSFRSQVPPGIGAFHARGFAQFPGVSGVDEAEAERLAEELAEACPQLARPMVDQGVIGRTIVPVQATSVRIDVKPGEGPNPVNPRSQGVIPVAILGTSALDVRTVDGASVRLGVGQVSARGGGHVEDVNGDGRADLVFQFPTQGTELRCGDTVLVLTGRMAGGGAISGFDSIVTPGCR